jgi:hypothetical protein
VLALSLGQRADALLYLLASATAREMLADMVLGERSTADFRRGASAGR